MASLAVSSKNKNSGFIFKLNIVDKKYLKEYVKYDFNYYENLVDNCEN